MPTFPDLDAMYRALRSASRQPTAKDRVASTSEAGAAAVAGLSLGDASPYHFQWNLITNTLANLDEQQKASVPDHVRQTILGDFATVLTSSMATSLLKPIGALLGQALTSNSNVFDLGSVQKQVNSAVSTHVKSEAESFEALSVAVSALHAFVQINWTGPELPDALEPLLLLRASSSDCFPPRPLDAEAEDKANGEAKRLIHGASLEALAFKGEPAYHLCQVPFFLVFSKLVIEALWTAQSPGDGKMAIETLPWWRLRALTVHSHVLDEPVAFGKKVFDPVNKLRDVLTARAAATSKDTKSAWASLSARLILERGVALQRLGSDREASETFVDAAKENGLRYRMSGALGKRTKFQKEDKTQLVLLAKSVVVDGGKEDEEAEKDASPDKEKEVEGVAQKEEQIETVLQQRQTQRIKSPACHPPLRSTTTPCSSRPNSPLPLPTPRQATRTTSTPTCSFSTPTPNPRSPFSTSASCSPVPQHPQHPSRTRPHRQPDADLHLTRRLAPSQLDGAHHVSPPPSPPRIDTYAHRRAIRPPTAGADRSDADQRLVDSGTVEVLPRARSAAQVGDAGGAGEAVC